MRKPVEDELLHDGIFCGVCEMVNLLSSDEIKKLVFHMFLPSGTFSFWHSILPLTPVSLNTENDNSYFLWIWCILGYFWKLIVRKQGWCTMTHGRRTLGGHSDKDGHFSQRQIMSNLQTITHLSLWKQAKANVGRCIKPSFFTWRLSPTVVSSTNEEAWKLNPENLLKKKQLS